MRKIVILCLLFLMAGSVCWAEPAEKTAVVVLASRNIRTNTDAMNTLVSSIYAAFDPAKYDVKIWGKDSTPPFMDYVEKTTNEINKGARMVKKEYCVQYGKDIGSNKVVSVLIMPVDPKVQGFLFARSLNFKIQADITGFNVASDKYLFTDSLATEKEGNLKESVNMIAAKIANYKMSK